ncbi:hypothetical protein Plhal304r1_c043g0123651 [Plasmopara halstedii]
MAISTFLVHDFCNLELNEQHQQNHDGCHLCFHRRSDGGHLKVVGQRPWRVISASGPLDCQSPDPVGTNNRHQLPKRVNNNDNKSNMTWFEG